MKRIGPEASTQSTILGWLAATRVWHQRMNTGAVSGEHNGKKRFVQFNKPGTADILSTPLLGMDALGVKYPVVAWIEVKAPGGKQSAEQKQFEMDVTEAGHLYILAYSLDDVIQKFEEFA